MMLDRWFGWLGRNSYLSRLSLSILIGFLTLPAAAQGPPPAAVRVDAVKLEQVQERRMVTGELKAVRRARVATEEAGLVLEIPVEEGQSVKKGDVLARLDSKRLEIELLQVQADEQVTIAGLEERRADVQWRELDLENYKGLTKGGASNPKELYDAESQAKIAKAKLAAAERQVQAIHARAALLEKRIADTVIKAPFEGDIVAKNTEQGQWLEAGAAAVEMISTGVIEAWLDVPQQLALAVMRKQPEVMVVIEATGAMIKSSQLRAIPLVDPKARALSAIVTLKNDDHAMASGMSVTAWIPTGKSGEQLTISKNAVLRNQVSSFVYVARSAGRDAPAIATPVDVEVLFSIDDRVVVKSSALVAGDLLIVEGNERLFPMSPVMPMLSEQAQK